MFSGKQILAFCSAILMGVVFSACSNAPQSKLSSAPVPEQRPAEEVALLEGGDGNGSTETTTPSVQKRKAHTSDKTKFSSRQFGVDGSPRVTKDMIVRKGGGYYHVGKPYVIRGKRYVPKEDPDYKAVGLASWYGPNFHGRLTANGEVYDQYGLSAAHPTMPLPSYARVTNLDNGSSVLVRVNDRGPFSKNRVIDLSSRAAQLLGYTKKGLAKVKVEYAGKAQLDGLDEPFLLASYDPGTLNPQLIPDNPRGEFKVAYAETAGEQGSNRVSLQAINDASKRSSPLVSGHPVDISGLRTPRPKGLVNGYMPEVDHTGVAAISAWQSAQPILPPEQGMGQLVRYLVGPVTNSVNQASLSTLASRFGPVGWMVDSSTTDRYLIMSFDVAEEHKVQKFLSRNKLTAVRR